MKQYKSGYILGKFFPLTLGHKHLIDSGLEHCEKLTVLICSLNSENIPGELRFSWLKEVYKKEPRITIKHCSEELPQYPEEDTNFWNIWIDVAKRYCPSDIDVILTSENYGETYANYLGIKHHMVDIERRVVPISGTKVRGNPLQNWKFIPNEVKPFFVKRIAVMGPESTGKSTLTANLANYFSTNFVPEYGRLIYEIENKVEIKDFIPISKGRQEIEDWMIKSSNKFIFCDTEDITTYIFSKMYCPNEYLETEEYFLNILKEKKKYDLYLLLKPDCQSIQDGTRNFLKEREDHYNVIKNWLKKLDCNYIEIGGDWKERTETSIEIIKDLLLNE